MRSTVRSIARNGIGLCFLGCSIALRTEVVGDTGSESGVDAFGAPEDSSAMDRSVLEPSSDTSIVEDSSLPDSLPDTALPPGSCASKLPYLFCDDFENGIGQWTPIVSQDVTCKVASLAVGPNGGPTNVLAIDVDGKAEGFLSRSIAIPVTSTQVEVQLRFRYDSFLTIGEDLFFATILTHSGGGDSDDGYSFYLDRRIATVALARFKTETIDHRKVLTPLLIAANWYGVSVRIDKTTRNYVTKLVAGGSTMDVDQGQLRNADALNRLELQLGFTGADGNDKKASLFVDEVVVR